jgi:6-phosphogluconolactonase (cycloisomerase 2 family)
MPSGGLEELQTLRFTLKAPGAPGSNPDRQELPHPHEALVDPTDSFILVPDLGADLVRVFSIDAATSRLTESTPLQTPPGSGPRHGAFLVSGAGTFLFVVFELTNIVTSYKVTYRFNMLAFEEVFSYGLFGGSAIPSGASVAEVLISVSSLAQ